MNSYSQALGAQPNEKNIIQKNSPKPHSLHCEKLPHSPYFYQPTTTYFQHLSGKNFANKRDLKNEDTSVRNFGHLCNGHKGSDISLGEISLYLMMPF